MLATQLWRKRKNSLLPKTGANPPQITTILGSLLEQRLMPRGPIVNGVIKHLIKHDRLWGGTCQAAAQASVRRLTSLQVHSNYNRFDEAAADFYSADIFSWLAFPIASR